MGYVHHRLQWKGGSAECDVSASDLLLKHAPIG